MAKLTAALSFGTRRTAWTEREYRPFPNEQRRNARHEMIEIPLMVWVLGLPPGGRILEVGCGRGIALPALARALQPRRLVGIDIDAGLIETARERINETHVAAELYTGDVRALPFPDASFDLVVDFGTCYHIAGASKALAQIARVLAPGGLFVEETRLNQFLSHPVRSFGRFLPWSGVPGLGSAGFGLLWSSRVRWLQ